MKYEPDPKLTKAVIKGIIAPLPFGAGLAAKVIPGKKLVVGKALACAVPLALHTIACTQKEGTRLALTKDGKLTEETKRSLLARIAIWFVPSEVKDVVEALQGDVVRLGHEGYHENTWYLEMDGAEVVLVVVSTSLLKSSADTVADVFMSSYEKLREFKDKLPKVRMPFTGSKQ